MVYPFQLSYRFNSCALKSYFLFPTLTERPQSFFSHYLSRFKGKGGVKSGGSCNLKRGLRLKAYVAGPYHFLETPLHALSCSKVKNCRILRKCTGMASSLQISSEAGLSGLAVGACKILSSTVDASSFASRAGERRPSSCASLSKS